MSKREWSKTTELIGAAVDVLEAQNPMTIRQLFYQLVSRGILPNSLASYQLVSRLMTKAREDGRVDFEYIVDRSRPEYSKTVWEDAAAYAEGVKRYYRKDYWTTQPCHVEVWVEKDAIIGSIEEVVKNELGVTIRVGRGFQSTTRLHEVAAAFGFIEKPIHVFYLGDHDPSGVAIERDMTHRLVENLYRLNAFDVDFRVSRLAIFQEDIENFGLPPLRVKDSDSRASTFLRQHGSECVELDALPPEELRSRLRNAIEGLIDFELWNRAVAVENVELASIRDAAAMWSRCIASAAKQPLVEL